MFKIWKICRSFLMLIILIPSFAFSKPLTNRLESSQEIILAALNHASIKYYERPLNNYINKKYFRGTLSNDEEKTFEKVFANYNSVEFLDKIGELIDKHHSVLAEDWRIDKVEYPAFEMKFLIGADVNTLYHTRDVQEIVMKKIFSQENKKILDKYFSLVKNEEIKEMPKHILNKWNGVNNYLTQVRKTTLFWPSMEKLAKHFVPIQLNGKKAYSLEDSSQNLVLDLPEGYEEFYLNLGTYLYFTKNSTAFTIGDVDDSPYVLVYPELFLNTNDPGNFSRRMDLNLVLLGVFAHELGHPIAFFSNDGVGKKQFEKAPKNETADVVDNIIAPFFNCFNSNADHKDDQSFMLFKLSEARADAVANIIINSLAEKIGFNKNIAFEQLLKTLDDVPSNGENIDTDGTSDIDPHADFKEREKILKGVCKMKTIPPFFSGE